MRLNAWFCEVELNAKHAERVSTVNEFPLYSARGVSENRTYQLDGKQTTSTAHTASWYSTAAAVVLKRQARALADNSAKTHARPHTTTEPPARLLVRR